MRLSCPLSNVALAPETLADANGETCVFHSTIHRTTCSSIDIWEYEPGEFEWRSDADLSACVLSGMARVTLADGRDVTLGPGASLFLPQGMHGRWTVEEKLRTVTVRDQQI